MEAHDAKMFWKLLTAESVWRLLVDAPKVAGPWALEDGIDDAGTWGRRQIVWKVAGPGLVGEVTAFEVDGAFATHADRVAVWSALQPHGDYRSRAEAMAATDAYLREEGWVLFDGPDDAAATATASALSESTTKRLTESLTPALDLFRELVGNDHPLTLMLDAVAMAVRWPGGISSRTVLTGEWARAVEMIRQAEWAGPTTCNDATSCPTCLYCGAYSPTYIELHYGSRVSKPGRWGPGRGEHHEGCRWVAFMRAIERTPSVEP